MLREALDYLLPQAESVPFRTEFVFVDDGSNNRTPEVLQAFQQRARVPVTILRSEGISEAAAHNLAVEHSRGTWLACCDDTGIAAPDWLFSLYEAALCSSADFVGGAMHLCVPDCVSSAASGLHDRRSLGGQSDYFEGPLGSGRDLARNNMLVRTEVMRCLGGFCTSATQGGEHTDLFDRARAAGHTLWFTPRARMFKVPAESRLPSNDQRRTTMRVAASNRRSLRLGRDVGCVLCVTSVA